MANTIKPYTTIQLTALVILRVLIGWFYLYEDILKLINPYWASVGFLLESQWIFSNRFKSIVTNPIVFF